MWNTGSLALREHRAVSRDEVHHRAGAILADGTATMLLIVDVSPAGMMARTDGTFTEGDRLRVSLPTLGRVEAEVRWALGGRIGCQFTTPIELAAYGHALPAMLGSGARR